VLKEAEDVLGTAPPETLEKPEASKDPPEETPDDPGAT
jgi:hypothetical protein